VIRCGLLTAPLVVAALATFAASTTAGPITQDSCADAADPVPFVTGTDDYENLHFHNGLLYATGSDGLLHAFAPDGMDSVVATLGPRSGAMVTGVDGALYVRVGGGPGEVWRFEDPPNASSTVVASGIPAANGLAIDGTGNLYVSNEAQDIFRLPANDLANWSSWASVEGANGLIVNVSGGLLYAAITDDQRSAILAISLDDPTNVTDVAHLSFGAARVGVFERPPPASLRPASDPSNPLILKALDDLTLGPDGMLYAAAWMTGEILRVDPATGGACVVAAGIDQPSSVRVAQGFGEYDGDLFVTDFGGHAGLAAKLPGSITRVPLGLESINYANGTDGAAVPAPVEAPRDVAAQPLLVVVIVIAAATLVGRSRK